MPLATLDIILVWKFLAALLIGALVGVEREKHKNASREITFGGMRTYILSAEAGAASAWLGQILGTPWIFIFTVLAVAALVGTAYTLEHSADPKSLGLTTEVAAINVCLLGGAVMYDQMGIAVALAIINTAVLAFKQPLHGIVAKLGTEDIYAGLKLLIASFIVLPLLPDYTVDPLDALNPYKLWLLVVLISALSLTGYIATRWLGTAHGTAITGLTGGIVSSTAVSLSFARDSHEHPDEATADALSSGILIAWTIMYLRVLLMVVLTNTAMLKPLLGPFLAMFAVNGLAAIWYYLRSVREGVPSAEPAGAVALKNPFSLVAATKFGLIFAIVLLVVEFTRHSFHGGGLVAVATLAGLTDVDAITLSMTHLGHDSSQLNTALIATVAGTLANTVTKCGMAVLFGSPALRRRVLPVSAAVILTGIAATMLMAA